VKVGIVTAWGERGAGYVSRAYRQALSAAHDVFIYARDGEHQARGDPVWDTGDVTWARRSPLTSRTSWRHIRGWARRRQLDVLIFNEQHGWRPVIRARRELRAAIGAYVDYYTEETVGFFRLYDFLLCNTRRHLSVFKDHGGALYIPWGTDCELFTGDCSPVDSGSITFFQSAGMNPQRKGTLLALQAFRRLEGDHRFLLHLQVPLACDPRLEEQCRADDRVEVVNRAVKAPGLYHRGDVYVYPTRLEGIGLTVPEALASGLPVIATDAPPMNELVRHGENGYLVKPVEYRGRFDGYYWAESHCDVDGVLEAMRYYAENLSRLAEFKRAARASAEQRLDWRVNSAELPGLLEGVRRGPRGGEDDAELEKRAAVYSHRKALHHFLSRFLR
jgi:glycosyltransferase involved in cell wall biosynthesis